MADKATKISGPQQPARSDGKVWGTDPQLIPAAAAASTGRWTSALNDAAAAEQSIVAVTFVDLDISGDRQRLNDSNLTLTWGGFDWQGVGTFGGIEAIAEASDLVSQPLRLTLSGVETQNITDAMTTQYQGRAVVVYVGLLNKDTLAFIADPEEVWSGYMDVMTLEADQGSGTITLTCEHWLRIAPAVSRYTDEEQQALYSGDRFFQYLHEIPNYIGKWGHRDVTHGGGGSGEAGSPINRRQPF